MPALVEARAQGVSIGHYIVVCESAATAGRVLQRAPGAFVIAELVEPPGISFASVARAIGDLVETEQQVRALPGVLDVGRQTPLRVGVASERIAQWVDAEEARWRQRTTPS